MDKVTLALLLIGFVHVVGAVLLFALLFERGEFRDWWPGDGGGGGSDEPDVPPAGGPPLGSAEPADARLRTSHDRLRRRGGRVREREPEPARTAR